MKLDNKELFQLYQDKEINYFYHANTVRTSRTFIDQGGLLSRGAVEDKKLNQTAQSSDDIDKLFGVWSDIFLDTTDLHTYFGRQNYYGPVLFKFSIDFLNEENYEIWVTKDNPINWNQDMDDNEKFFTSVEELRSEWNNYQRQRKMTIIKNNSEPVLFEYIKDVIVDNPAVKDPGRNIVYFNQAVSDLKESLKINPPLKNKFSTRKCSGCFCRSNYLHQHSIQELNQLFL